MLKYPLITRGIYFSLSEIYSRGRQIVCAVQLLSRPSDIPRRDVI